MSYIARLHLGVHTLREAMISVPVFIIIKLVIMNNSIIIKIVASVRLDCAHSREMHLARNGAYKCPVKFPVTPRVRGRDLNSNITRRVGQLNSN